MVLSTCSVCLRSISTTSTGVLRSHGPMSARCPGSGKPPRPSASQPVLPARAQSPTLSVPGQAPPLPATPSLSEIPKVRVINCVPKSARHQCSVKLTSLLVDVVRSNSLEAWDRLLLFATSGLKLPRRRGKHSESLSSLVRRQLQGCPASSDQLMPTHHRGKQSRGSYLTLSNIWLGRCLRS